MDVLGGHAGRQAKSPDTVRFQGFISAIAQKRPVRSQNFHNHMPIWEYATTGIYNIYIYMLEKSSIYKGYIRAKYMKRQRKPFRGRPSDKKRYLTEKPAIPGTYGDAVRRLACRLDTHFLNDSSTLAGRDSLGRIKKSPCPRRVQEG